MYKDKSTLFVFMAGGHTINLTIDDPDDLQRFLRWHQIEEGDDMFIFDRESAASKETFYLQKKDIVGYMLRRDKK